jgi:hypothetical protein
MQMQNVFVGGVAASGAVTAVGLLGGYSIYGTIIVAILVMMSIFSFIE